MENLAEFSFPDGGCLSVSSVINDDGVSGWEIAQVNNWAVVVRIGGWAVGMTADQATRLTALIRQTDGSERSAHIDVPPYHESIRVVSGRNQVKLTLFERGIFTGAQVDIPADRCTEIANAITAQLA
jgi:hypothetical protein